MRKIKLSAHDGLMRISFNLNAITMARTINRYSFTSGLGKLRREFVFSTEGAAQIIAEYHALADSVRGTQKEVFLREIADELEQELQARLPALVPTMVRPSSRAHARDNDLD